MYCTSSVLLCFYYAFKCCKVANWLRTESTRQRKEKALLVGPCCHLWDLKARPGLQAPPKPSEPSRGIESHRNRELPNLPKPWSSSHSHPNSSGSGPVQMTSCPHGWRSLRGCLHYNPHGVIFASSQASRSGTGIFLPSKLRTDGRSELSQSPLSAPGKAPSQ